MVGNFYKLKNAILLAVVFLTASVAFAQVSVYSSGGSLGLANTPYTTLKGAIDAINSGSHQGDVDITITASTTETAPIVLNSSTAPASYDSISIKTSGSGPYTISGAGTVATGALFVFDRANKVKIDGGINKSLIFKNTSATYPSVFWFRTSSTIGVGSGCSNDTIMNCQINAGSMSAAVSYGIAVSATGAAPAMNAPANSCENILIANNKIYNAFTGIGVIGSTGNVNTNFVIRGNEIGNDVAASSIYKYGVYANTFDQITIENNKIYNVTGGSVSNGVFGLYVESTLRAKVRGNNILNITTAVTSGTISPYGPIAGIYFKASPGITTDKNIIEKNTIQNIAYTGSEAKNVDAYGVYLSQSDYSDVLNNVINGVVGSGYGALATVTDFTYGILVNQTNNLNVYHNTVNLFGTYKVAQTGALNFSAALGFSSAMMNVNVKNNIFIDSLVQSGVANRAYGVYCATGMAFGGTNIINYNDYYIIGSNPKIGFGGGADLAAYATDWKTWSVTDLNSITANPKFNSISNLCILPGSPVIGVGGALPAVGFDITGAARSATAPSMGAYELGRDVVAPVISYTALGASSYAATTKTFSNVAITDNSAGIATGVNAPRVYYKKSTSTNDFASWQSVPANGTTSPYTFTINYSTLGTVAVGDIIQYFVVAQDLASTPNVTMTTGLTVTGTLTNVNLTSGNFPINGTIQSYTLLTPFEGEILVGAGQTYTTFTTATTGAFAALNSKTVTGDITFKVTSNITEPGTVGITTANNPGAYNIKIVPDAAVERVITNTAGTTAIFKMTNINNVIVDGSFNGVGRYLTFKDNNSSSTSRAVIQLYGAAGLGCKNVTIQNCNISSFSSTSSAAYGVYVGDVNYGVSNDANNINIVINNNIIKKAYYGIFIGGSSAASNTNLTISRNIIGGDVVADYIGYYGLYLTGAPGALISKNEIYNIKSSSTYQAAGIYINSLCNRMTLEKNIVHGIWYTGTSGYGEYGIMHSSSDSVNYINNLVYDILSDGDDGIDYDYDIAGIKIKSGNELSFYHNSINMFGQLYAGSYNGATSSAICFMYAPSSLKFKNNNLVNTITTTKTPYTGQGSFSIAFTTSPIWANLSMNYNNYFSNSLQANMKFLGLIGSTTIADLTTWQTSTNSRDMNSFSIDPQFASNTSLMPGYGNLLYSGVVNGGGIGVGVATDIMDLARNTTNPSIGAYESFIDIAPPQIAYTPLANCDCSIVATNRDIIATISDNSGQLSATNLPRMYFKKYKQSNDSLSWKFVLPNGGPTGNDYTFTFDPLAIGGILPGEKVQYFFVAQDPIGLVSISNGLTTAKPLTSTAIPADAFPIGGTINKWACIEKFSGVRTVGVGGYFPTFTGPEGVFEALNGNIVSDNTTFKVISDITEPGTVTLNNITYENNINYNITIAPDTNTLRTLTGSIAGSLFRFENVHNLTIDGSNNGTGKYLKFVNAISCTTAYAATFSMASKAANQGCSNISFNNSIIVGPTDNWATTSYKSYGIYAGDATLSAYPSSFGYIDSINIIGSNIYKGTYGVFNYGSSTKRNLNWIVKKNKFGGASNSTDNVMEYGFYSYYSDLLKLDSNTFTDMTTVYSVLYGAYLYYCDNSSMRNNKVLNFTAASQSIYGLYAAYCNFLNVANNKVSNNSNTSSTNYGLDIAYSSDANIYGNEVTGLTTTTGGCYGIASYHPSSSWGKNISIINNAVSGLKSTSGNMYGFYLYGRGATNYVVKHNSANLTGTKTGLTAAFYAGYGSATYLLNIDSLVNNSFTSTCNITGTTVNNYAIYLTGSATVPWATITYADNNNYYVDTLNVNSRLGYANATAYKSLSLWKARNTSLDVSSLDSIPRYSSATSLAPQSTSWLISHGIDAGVPFDIYGNARIIATNPSIGAFEKELDLVPPIITYTPLSSTVLFTNRTIDVTITDAKSGIDTVIGPKLYYKKTSQSNTLASWKTADFVKNGSVYTFTIDYAKIGGINLYDRIQYFVVAKDLAGPPNFAINSGSPAEDITSTTLLAANFPITGSINEYGVLAPISGVKTVGVGGNFTSLTGDDTLGLFKSMSKYIVSGDLTINIISDLTETGQIALNSLAKNGNWNVKILPSAPVERIISGDISVDNSLIKIINTDGLTIDGSYNGSGKYLTFKANSAPTSSTATIAICGTGSNAGSKNITIKNTNIMNALADNTSKSATVLYIGTMGLSTTSDANNDNISIINNNISRGNNGIVVGGSSSASNDNLLISGNTIGSKDNDDNSNFITFSGINVYGSPMANIVHNEILNLKSKVYPVSGIYVGGGSDSMLIQKNIIHTIWYIGSGGYGSYGINIEGSDKVKMYNNAIYKINNDGWSFSGTDNAKGIRINAGNSHIIYNNTINLFGGFTDGSTTSTDASQAIHINNAADGLKIVDNILSNTIIGASCAIAYTTKPTNSYFNYNVYYAPTNLGYTGSYVTSMPSWLALGFGDTNSVFANPMINRDTVLTLQYGSPALFKGVKLAEITDDILDTIRRTPPSIGAYEIDQDFVGPVIAFNKLKSTSSLTNRILTTNISDLRTGLDVIDKPKMYYKKSSDINNTLSAWKVANAVGTAPNYTFEIDYTQIGAATPKDIIQYFIVARDIVSPLPNYSVSSGKIAGTLTSTTLNASNFPITGVIDDYAVAAPISGVKTVGVGGDFTSLTDTNGLFATMQYSVITGDLTVKIISNLTESGAVALSKLDRENGNWKFNIEPSTRTVKTISGSFDGAGLIRLISVNDLSIDGSFSGSGRYLNFINTSTTNYVNVTPLQISGSGAGNGCNNVIVKNCMFSTGLNSNSSSMGIFVGNSSSNSNLNTEADGDNNNIIISNNIFTSAYTGIYIGGSTATNDNLEVSNNIIGSADLSKSIYFYGINLFGSPKAKIIGNEIFNIKNTATSKCAFNINGNNNFAIITKNSIHGIHYTGSGGY